MVSDPHHHDLYLKYSKYLAVLNNQSLTNVSQSYGKINVLHRLVLAYILLVCTQLVMVVVT